MTICRALLPLLLFAVLFAAADPLAAEVTAEKSDKGVVVEIDGKPFAEYLADCNGTPAVWPIVGPTGKHMTRAYPMGERPGEKEDHPHHRSMWFTHGDVNGMSFWHREKIKHREFVEVRSGDTALIVTKNDWLAPDGSTVCKDERTLRFGAIRTRGG